MPELSLPEPLFIDRVESPIGTMLVFHDSEERLRALDFHDYEPRMRRLLRLHWGREGHDFVVESRATPMAIRRALAAYFAGDLAAIDTIPVTTAGTSFQREVWAALRRIRPGTTLSYGHLAQQLGRPSRFAPSVLPTAPTLSPSWSRATALLAPMQDLPVMAAGSSARSGCLPTKAPPSGTPLSVAPPEPPETASRLKSADAGRAVNRS